VLDLLLLRHGESVWNAQNRFTGWVDVELSDNGRSEAVAAGRLMAAEADLDLRLLHTSVLVRAITTAELALHEAGRSWVPAKRSWRLNERHYGALQGLDKRQTAARHGEDQVRLWRRSYAVPPPALQPEHPDNPVHDPRYRDVDPAELPLTECLADVVRRVVPYWEQSIVPDLVAEADHGGAVLVVAHGNSIRALRKHIEHISDSEIADLEIPTGIPYRCRFDDHLQVTYAHYLGDPERAMAAADAVRRQSEL
jgi:2,3-bisphosphoglycerate-dependent phosphoglycerate mutase